MGWREQYSPGSFRGVAFLTVSHDAPVGRRGEDHDYPFRDIPWFEDLGRKGRAWNISCFVIGDDYMAQRDALLAACEASGPGTLVHPWLGTFQAQLVNARLSESVEEGGIARFELSFVEPGIAVTAQVTADTQATATAASQTTDSQAATRFAGTFAAAGAADFVQSGSSAFISGIADTVALAAQVLGGAGAVLRTFHSGISLLSGATALLGVPATLAQVMLGMIDAVSQLGDRPAMQVAVLRSLMATIAATPIQAPVTPSRAQESTNQQASIDLVLAGCAGAAVRVIAGVDFASYDDAVAVRDHLAGDLDDQALSAHDRGNPALADDLDTLRRTMVADVTARGGSLQRLFTWLPVACRPALAIAWSVYRDPALLGTEADDLVARNKIVHPLFVPVAPLQLLTPAATQASAANAR